MEEGAEGEGVRGGEGEPCKNLFAQLPGRISHYWEYDEIIQRRQTPRLNSDTRLHLHPKH